MVGRVDSGVGVPYKGADIEASSAMRHICKLHDLCCSFRSICSSCSDVCLHLSSALFCSV